MTDIGVYSIFPSKKRQKAFEIADILEVKPSLHNKISPDTISSDSVCIRMLSPSSSARGYRNHVAFIDSNIDKDTIHNIIIPTIVTREGACFLF